MTTLHLGFEEIKRTLDNIPAGIAKPKAHNIATLGKGQFYACWAGHVIKTYVQPAWMMAARARRTEQGKRTLTPDVDRLPKGY